MKHAHNFNNRTGLTFGRLTVKRIVGRSLSGQILYRCICTCGQFITVPTCNLLRSHTSSCGCLQKECSATKLKQISMSQRIVNGKNSSTVHGYSTTENGHPTRTYNSWVGMNQRCTNPKTPYWHIYGGATPPVRVCKRWLKFENFLTDMGPRPTNTSLSRLADSGDYKTGNVVWGTRAHQAEQKRLKRLSMKRT